MGDVVVVTNRGELDLGNGERLPWLETAEDYDTRRRRGWGAVVAVVLAALALVILVGGVWYARGGAVAGGNGELIAAEPTPYKVPATGDDGMRVGNESDAMLATSEGEEASGRIAGVDAPATGLPTPAGAVGLPPTTQPVPATAASGAAVQLGAFDDAATAEERWAGLARNQRRLASLPHTIEQVEAGGKTVFRLRAGVADRRTAAALCEELQKAKVACFAVG